MAWPSCRQQHYLYRKFTIKRSACQYTGTWLIDLLFVIENEWAVAGSEEFVLLLIGLMKFRMFPGILDRRPTAMIN